MSFKSITSNVSVNTERVFSTTSGTSDQVPIFGNTGTIDSYISVTDLNNLSLLVTGVESNCIYVDALYGTDSTAERNNILKPFNTLDSAILSSNINDKIYLNQGTYEFTESNTLESRTFHLSPNTIIIFSIGIFFTNCSFILDTNSELYFNSNVSFNSSCLIKMSNGSKMTCESHLDLKCDVFGNGDLKVFNGSFQSHISIIVNIGSTGYTPSINFNTIELERCNFYNSVITANYMETAPIIDSYQEPFDFKGNVTLNIDTINLLESRGSYGMKYGFSAISSTNTFNITFNCRKIIGKTSVIRPIPNSRSNYTLNNCEIVITFDAGTTLSGWESIFYFTMSLANTSLPKNTITLNNCRVRGENISIFSDGHLSFEPFANTDFYLNNSYFDAVSGSYADSGKTINIFIPSSNVTFYCLNCVTNKANTVRSGSNISFPYETITVYPNYKLNIF